MASCSSIKIPPGASSSRCARTTSTGTWSRTGGSCERSGVPLTDIDLVYKKLAFIEACVDELKTLGHPEEVRRDLREQRFEAYTLQVAIQAAIDIAAHIVSDERLGFASKNRDYFELLVRNGWLPN